MTIAAGFHSNTGIVLCADTEETLGDTKQWVGKIDTIVYPQTGNVVCLAGAGWTDYILTAIEQATDGLAERKRFIDIRNHLQKKLLDFFDRHLARWAYFPASERPYVELLIGVTTRAGPSGLLYYGGTAFYSTREKAIGSGVVLANNLISEYRSGNESLEELCRLAVLVLSRVKKGVVGCGGDTHLVTIKRDGHLGFVEDKEVRRIEFELEGKLRKHNTTFEEVMKRCSPVSIGWVTRNKTKPTTAAPSSEP